MNIPKLFARVTAVPPNLPADDLGTADLFAQCVGRSFEVIGRNGPLVELAVGTLRGEAPIMHSIWIETQLIELSFEPLPMSAKMLNFLIEAVDFRIAAFCAELETGLLGEDAASDICNDAALLGCLVGNLKRRAADMLGAPAPAGDATARAKLRMIMECLQTEGFSEAEQDALITMGRSTSPDPAWTDYLYWPDRFGLDGSIDAALEKVFFYSAIRL